MKKTSTIINLAVYALLAFPLFSMAQYSPGLPAGFGIDGDAISGLAQNATSSMFPQGSFDWFKKTGNGPNIGFGVIDISNTATYATQIATGQNISFSRGMAFSRYSNQGGYLLLDARYARDNFGLSSSAGRADMTTYTSGSKNGDDPTMWVTTPTGGMVADKADIIDTYIHMRRDGLIINNTNPSPLILAMAVNTIGNTGNRYVDFELFRTRIDYNYTTGIFSNSGPATSGGHSEWKFNADGTVKEIGDMSVSFAYSTSGIDEVSVFIWVSETVYNNTSPARFNFVPGNFHGSGYGYAKVTPLSANAFKAWGSVTSANTSAAPWGTNSKSNGSSNSNYTATSYAANDYGEVAIDLTSMGIDPALSVGMDPCVPPFTRVMAKTRSSANFSSALQDFTGPYEFLDAPVISPQIATPANLRCNVSTVTLSPAVTVSGAVYQWTTSNGNIISDPNATSITVDKTGKYYLTAAIVAGCPQRKDSAIVTSDYFQPIASASVDGQLTPGLSTSTVELKGGDVNLSNFATPYGGSAGLSWKWTGPNGFTANVRNPETNMIGDYTLELTELRNGCKDTAATLVTNAIPLPVKFMSFDAVVKEKAVVLNWVTTNEINHSHFDVERSFEGTNFKKIGSVSVPVKITGDKNSYKHTDNDIELQSRQYTYYRLKQIDIDGKSGYSKVIMLRLNPKPGENMKVIVSPNPFSEKLTVSYEAAESGIASVNLMNASGQILLSKQTIVVKGYNNLHTEGLHTLSPGMYFVQLLVNGKVISNQKIIKN